MSEHFEDTIAEHTRRIVRHMNEHTEAALSVLVEHYDGIEEARAAGVVVAHVHSGFAEGDARRIEVDGATVWRLWWEPAGEYVWTLRDEWLVPR